jgi:hypothetical protein
MNQENEKYYKVLKLLRNSGPAIESMDEIENEVIKRIKNGNNHRPDFPEIFDFLFGWVYIGWVRRSLIAASIALVLVFVYQQAVILRRIDILSRQTIVIDRGSAPAPSNGIEKLMTLYRNSERKLPYGTIVIHEDQMQQLIESINELKVKYKDLENLIETDPELKKLIEKKMIENNRTKINL